MSQDAYALFQNIKKIKGYIIMSLRSLTNAGLVLPNSRLIKQGTTNIQGNLGTSAMRVHNIQTIAESATPTGDAYGAIVKLSGSRYIKITPLLSRVSETVSSTANTCNVRITGWDYVIGIGYMPTIVYYAPLQNSLTTTTFSVNGDTLKGYNGLFPTSTFGVNNSADTFWSASTTGSSISPSNLILPTLGYKYLEFEFPTLLGNSDNVTRTNAIITEFN